MATYRSELPSVFAALSDRTRLAVVEQLVSGPASVSELAAAFPMAGPSFLKHLRVLQDAGLITSVKKGRVRTVKLAPEPLTWVDDWLQSHRAGLESRLDRLGVFLKEEQ